MLLTKIILIISLFTFQLSLAAHVISDKNRDCSIKNGQIIKMDWTACLGAKYDNLSINLKPFPPNSQAHYYIKRNGNAKIATICIRDQFSNFDLYLDNGKYGVNQKRLNIITEFDAAYMSVVSHSLNPDGSDKAPVPIFVSIRNAHFSLNGKPPENQPTLSSKSDESVEAYNVRPPNYEIDIIYC